MYLFIIDRGTEHETLHNVSACTCAIAEKMNTPSSLDICVEEIIFVVCSGGVE